ncbi:MAG: pentapeptide repeat-containing protein [Hyphomicrobiaceae bacterium]
MTEAARGGPEGEPPVNPYSLLEAVNESSDTVHTGWLIFILIMAYLMIAVAGVSHKDLLLETRVELPILQVKIEQAQFFQFAPMLLVLFHIGILSQLVLLARKALEFHHAVRALETTHRRTHPLRLELHNFFFVQAVAGPQRSIVMSTFLHGMTWLTLVVLPVILLLYIQISFLPNHDVDVAWMHRIFLTVDMLTLILIGIFLTRVETSFFSAFWRTGRQHPLGFGMTGLILTVVAFFSFFVATVPGERLDHLGQRLLAREPSADTDYAKGFVVPILSRSDGSLFGVFHRNLIVTGADLAAGKEGAAAEASINLRNRDLRYAKLDRSNLSRADMIGADLTNASLIDADLRNARLQCEDESKLNLEGRAQARCVDARGANLKRAKLAGARLMGIDLRDADLGEANLEGAEMSYALLTGANFFDARLEKANLTGGAQAQGANFQLASLQGADLKDAELQFADFTEAKMQGAALRRANLQGAVFGGADLEGADMKEAKLHGAKMTGADLRAADLRGAGLWRTEPTTADNMTLADLADAVVRPLEESEEAKLRTMILTIETPSLQRRMKAAFEAMMDAPSNGKWDTSPEHKEWQAFAANSTRLLPDDYRLEITEYLSKLMCKWRWSSGSVAVGIARRARRENSGGTSDFRGDLPAISERLRAKECPASDKIPAKVLDDLKLTVETLRGN